MKQKTDNAIISINFSQYGQIAFQIYAGPCCSIMTETELPESSQTHF